MAWTNIMVSRVLISFLFLNEVLCNQVSFNSLLDDEYPNSQNTTALIGKRRIKHEGDDSHYKYPRYKYGYSVHDSKTKDIKSAWEHRDGDSTKGEYSLVEPDGAIRIVKYVVNKDHGFQAIVERIPPPKSNVKEENSFQSFTPMYNSEKSTNMKMFNVGKFQPRFNPPQNYAYNGVHYQQEFNAKDFKENQRPFTQTNNPEYQDFSKEMNGKIKNHSFFSTTQKEVNDVGNEDDEEDDSEEEQSEDETESEHEDGGRKETPRFMTSWQQNNQPKYNFHSQTLQDVSDHYNMPVELNDENNVNFKPQAFINLNQNRVGFGINQLQSQFKPSPRDMSQEHMGFNPSQTGFHPVHEMNTGYFNKVPGKTASYQSINYNTPVELATKIIHPNENNLLNLIKSVQSNDRNLDIPKVLPFYEDTYYMPNSGNYKHAPQDMVQIHIAKLAPSINSPPSHNFPSTGHLLIPPIEKLPNYNENQNSKINVSPSGTPISHNHHHVGEFERYD